MKMFNFFFCFVYIHYVGKVYLKISDEFLGVPLTLIWMFYPVSCTMFEDSFFSRHLAQPRIYAYNDIMFVNIIWSARVGVIANWLPPNIHVYIYIIYYYIHHGETNTGKLIYLTYNAADLCGAYTHIFSVVFCYTSKRKSAY